MAKSIIISGNLGVGKTTLLNKIGNYLDWTTVNESVIENPYLTDFYSNKKDWSFHLQVYFLAFRSQQYLDIEHSLKPVIMDRSIHDDVNVFLPVLYELGNITQRDYETILQVYDVIRKTIPFPDLMVYLKAPANVIMQRIQKRGLVFDYQNISVDYISLIDSYYEKWINQCTLCPILKFDTNEYNFTDDTECLKLISDQIIKKL